MQLFFYIRGTVQYCETFKVLAQAQFWQWKRIDTKTGKERMILVQGGLRPSVLGCYEYVFPEDCLPTVLAIMGVTSSGDIGVSREIRKYKFKLAVLRKIIGCKKIPKKIFKEAAKIPVSVVLSDSKRGLSHLKNLVSVHVIGIKKDEEGLMNEYHQELL